MIRKMSLRGGAFALSLGLVASACANGGDGTPQPPADGTVTFDWTLAGVKDPNTCGVQDVATFDVVVTTPNGAPYAEFRESCEVFATTVSLPPGTYAANAVLLDPQNFERTTEIPVVPFDVISATDLAIPLDFPPSSFK
jgi:hypothetical protein